MLPEGLEQLSFVISSRRRNPTLTMHFNMTWENYGSQNGLAFHPGLHAPPCLSWLPRTSVPYHIPCLRKTYICLKELAGTQISETAMSCQFANRMRELPTFPAVPYFEISLSLGSWGQVCCLEAWSAMGWPKNRGRRPEEHSNASLPNSHLGTSSQDPEHQIYSRSV